MLHRRTDRDPPKIPGYDSAKQAMESAINELRKDISELEVLRNNPGHKPNEVRQRIELICLAARRLAVLAKSWQ